MPSGSTTRVWPASGRPIRPQGRTTSTSAIIRNTSTSVIFGKTRMPKACSWPISSAARKAPGTEPIPPTTVTTKASAITEMSMCGLAASLGVCSAPPSPASAAPRNSVPVNSSAWLTPSAPTISRSCVAARTSTPKRVLCISSHRRPSTSGPMTIRNSS